MKGGASIVVLSLLRYQCMRENADLVPWFRRRCCDVRTFPFGTCGVDEADRKREGARQHSKSDGPLVCVNQNVHLTCLP